MVRVLTIWSEESIIQNYGSTERRYVRTPVGDINWF